MPSLFIWEYKRLNYILKKIHTLATLSVFFISFPKMYWENNFLFFTERNVRNHPMPIFEKENDPQERQNTKITKLMDFLKLQMSKSI